MDFRQMAYNLKMKEYLEEKSRREERERTPPLRSNRSNRKVAGTGSRRYREDDDLESDAELNYQTLQTE